MRNIHFMNFDNLTRNKFFPSDPCDKAFTDAFTLRCIRFAPQVWWVQRPGWTILLFHSDEILPKFVRRTWYRKARSISTTNWWRLHLWRIAGASVWSRVGITMWRRSWKHSMLEINGRREELQSSPRVLESPSMLGSWIRQVGIGLSSDSWVMIWFIYLTVIIIHSASSRLFLAQHLTW